MSSKPTRSSVKPAPNWSGSKARYSTISAAAAGLALTLLAATCAAQDDVSGRWQTIDDDTGEAKSLVELNVDDGRLYGRVVELYRGPDEDPDPVCKKCSGAQQNQPIVGMQIIDGLRWDGEAWSNGTILDPANGKFYDTKLWLEEGALKVRGYLGLFFRTQTWQRR